MPCRASSRARARASVSRAPFVEASLRSRESQCAAQEVVWSSAIAASVGEPATTGSGPQTSHGRPFRPTVRTRPTTLHRSGGTDRGYVAAERSPGAAGGRTAPVEGM